MTGGLFLLCCFAAAVIGGVIGGWIWKRFGK